MPLIIREKLKFPSGFGAAVLIGVLHGRKQKIGQGNVPSEFASLAGEEAVPEPAPTPFAPATSGSGVGDAVDGNSPVSELEIHRREEWRANLRLLLVCFFISGVFTLATYFFPAIRDLPIFGRTAAATWLWTFNPSLAYIGQGVIMGPATTMHMLLGAIIGWAILSPLAKYRGWAPGPIEDWETGSKGWIVWISIAIMLADGIVSLSHVAIRSALQFWPETRATIAGRLPPGLARWIFPKKSTSGYTAIHSSDTAAEAASVPTSPLSVFATPAAGRGDEGEDEYDGTMGTHPGGNGLEKDAPADQQIGSKTVVVGLVLSIVFCIACIRFTFGALVPFYAIIISIAMALVLSIMGVRALGEVRLDGFILHYVHSFN
ncbi:OPT superfamily [Sporothrix stenoceras]|uniref:OPT superfamily n=1 Tax=Sporothrix stenoceras TaxID=5173 RepID=A0ABR3ZUG9_9PEZI